MHHTIFTNPRYFPIRTTCIIKNIKYTNVKKKAKSLSAILSLDDIVLEMYVIININFINSRLYTEEIIIRWMIKNIR